MELPTDLVGADLALDLGLDIGKAAFGAANPQPGRAHRARQPLRAEDDQRHQADQ